MMGSLFIDLVMCRVALFAGTIDGQKPPIPDFCSVHEKSPSMMLMRQDDAVKIVTTKIVDAAGSEMALNNPVIDQALLFVTSSQYHAERTVPGVVMQAAVRVAGEEAMNIGASASGKAKQVVAFQVGFALVATNDATGQHTGELKQQSVDEVVFFTHGVTRM